MRPQGLLICVNFDLKCPQIDSAERVGSHSSSPPRKHAMNTEGKSPTGTNDSMASGGQGPQTTPKVQTAQRKTNQRRKKETKGAKTQTNQAKPRGEAHEGKATPKGMQAGKTNEPENRSPKPQPALSKGKPNKKRRPARKRRRCSTRTPKGPGNMKHERRHCAPKSQEDRHQWQAGQTGHKQPTINWNEHATKPSFAHAQAKIEQPPCQPESWTQPTQNETIRTPQAWAVFEHELGRYGQDQAM